MGLTSHRKAAMVAGMDIKPYSETSWPRELLGSALFVVFVAPVIVVACIGVVVGVLLAGEWVLTSI